MKTENSGLTIRDWCHKYVDMCSDTLLLSVFDMLRSYASSSKNKEYMDEVRNKKSS